MKKLIVTGLVILLPLTLTIAIVVFIFNLLTAPFVGIVSGIFNYYGFLNHGLWLLTGEQLQRLISQIFILAGLVGFTVFLGWVTRWVFFHYFLQLGDLILHRIPFVNTIYKTTQDVIQTIFTSQTNSFKQVVMIKFPNAETYSIGLLTRDELPLIHDTEFAAVFVPTTPNPTSGFLLMIKREELVYVDMKIEEALKYVISCGVIFPTYKIISREEALASTLSKPSEMEQKLVREQR